jgi:tellurite resistance protein
MSLTPDATLPTTKARTIASLEHLTPTWFVLVLGWCGLSLAWLRATDILGEQALGLGLVAALMGVLIFVTLCIACVWRLHAHPEAVLADMRHPIRHAYMAALPISMILMANIGVQLFDHTSRTIDTGLTFIWCVGAVLEAVATIWVVAKWLKTPDQGGIQWATFTPIFFIPVVGNVLTPLAGLPLGLEAWSMAQFGVGALLWLVLLVLLFVRLAQAGPLPARLSPLLFITIVPPSIIGSVLLQLQAPLTLVWFFWGIAAFFLALSSTQLQTIREQPFSMAHWGMSFPMGAITTLTLRLSQEPGCTWLTLPATLLLALTSLLVLGLTLNTWRGLRQGQLLVADK